MLSCQSDPHSQSLSQFPQHSVTSSIGQDANLLQISPFPNVLLGHQTVCQYVPNYISGWGGALMAIRGKCQVQKCNTLTLSNM